ncbi:MAG: N-acetylglucosaminidase, partial [Coprococcus sp.]
MRTKANSKLHISLSAALIIWSILCISFVCLFMSHIHSDAASKYGCITPGVTNVYFRESPAGNPITCNGANIMLNGGQELEILSTSNSSWYKVSLTYGGNSYTGYVSSSFITIYDGNTSSGDTDFENYLTQQGFPESYKEQLRTLHAQHPNWIFKAVHTGLDWKDVVANEVNISGRVNNMVEGYSGNPRYNWRSTSVGYNYKTDTWSSYDGSTWFAASDALVTYYLDPRVYLYEEFVFAFETLSYDQTQTEAGVESILSGTFMSYTTPSGYKSTYAGLIVKAGKKSGVSPYHIASRIKQEVGATGTSGTNGQNSTYPGIYNFYNIGAFASPEGNAVTNGLRWASSGSSYGRPWNTIYKSISGGAQYIGNNYILKGQDTLYTQKFNVTYTDCLYSHQYMGNV